MQVCFRDSAPNQPTTENPAMFTPNPNPTSALCDSVA